MGKIQRVLTAVGVMLLACLIGAGSAWAQTANAGFDATTCATETINLNGTASGGTPGYTHAWTVFSGPNLSSTQFTTASIEDPTFTPTATGIYTLRYTVTDAILSTAFDDVVITVNAAVTSNAGPNQTMCIGGTISLNGTVGGGDGSYTLAWTVRPTSPDLSLLQFSSTSAEDPTFTPTTAGTYRLRLTVNDGVCAAAFNQVVITVNPLPTATVSGTATICAGSSTTLTAALTGTGPWNVTWSDLFVQSGVTSSPATRSVTPSSTTTYTVTAVSDANCTGTFSGSAIVTVNPLPTATVSGGATFCVGGSTTISAALTGTAPWNVTWSDGFLQSGVLLSPATRSVSPTSSTTYTVTALTDFNCTGTSFSGSAIVTVNPLPTATVSGTASICVGGSTTISAALTGTGPWNVTWSDLVVQTGVTSSPATRIVSPAVTTTYTVTALTDANCTGTSFSGNAVISVNPVPTATVSGSATICAGSPTTISAALTGTGPWNVTWSDLFVQTGITVSPATRSVSPTTNTTYNVTAVSDAICTGTFSGSAIITVNPLPTATVSGTATICAGSSTMLTAVLTGTGPWNITWSDAVTQSGIAASPATRSVNPASTTTYTVTAVSDAICAGTPSGSAVVTVNPLPTATVSGTATICVGNSTIISAALTGTAPWTITWSDAVTQSGITSSPATRSANPSSSTTYTVTAVSDANCTGTSFTGSAVVTVIPLPTATVNSGNATICAGSSTTLTAILTGTGPWNVTWSDGFPQTGVAASPASRSVNPTTTTTYTVTAVTGSGCPGTFSGSAVITVNPVPTATVTGTTTICAGSPATISVGLTGTAPWSITWSDIGVVSGITSSPVTRVVTPASSTTFTVTAVSDVNCSGTISGSAVITVNPLPTATVTGTTTICAGNSTTISAALTGTGPWSITWSDIGVQTGITISPVTRLVSPSISTTYSVTAVSDANCIGTILGGAVVTVNPLPTVSISGVDPANAATTYTYTATTNAAGIPTYLWTLTGGTINGSNTLSSVSVTTGAMGVTMVVTVTVTDGVTGCPKSATKNVTVNPLAPASPTNLTAVAVNGSQVNLAWTDNASNETSFKIERKTGVSGTYTEIAGVGVNVTNYIDTGVTSGTEYYYRVRAANGGGNSAYSNEANATAGNPVAAPSNLSATPVSSSQINLTWTDNASNETGFKIERKTGTNGMYTEIASVLQANVNSFFDINLASGTIYFYRVRAFNAAGNSAYSNEVGTTTLTTIVAPSNLTATTVSTGQINLAWTDNSNNETGFKIERKTGASGTYAEIATVGANVTSYSNIGLTSGTEYCYRVRAFNVSGNSAYSNEACATTTSTGPAAPSNLTATVVGSNQINVCWNDNSSNETGFVIECRIGSSSTWTVIASVTAGVTCYSNTGLAAATQYCYRVYATGASGNSSYSNEACGTTSPITPIPLNPPSNLAATTVGKTQINLTWTDNSTNEDGFRIERKLGTNGVYTEIAVVGANVTSYPNTGLFANGQYFYRVRAYNASGNSAYSNEANAITWMNGPSNLSGTAVSSSQINLMWTDNTTNETNFQIERKTGTTGIYALIGTAAQNATSFLDNSGLSANTQYCYRVRAVNAVNVSEYSNEACAMTNNQPGNLALQRPITASSTYITSTPTRGNDGNQVSFWRSAAVSNASPTAWLRVDLGSVVTIARVVILWNQNYFAKEYDIQVSSDGVNFTPVHTNNAGAAGMQSISFTPGPARYVRAFLKKQNLASYRLVELEVYCCGAVSKQNGQATTENAVIPESIALEQNYPNPFNPSTTISFSLPAGANVSLKVINVNGQEVATLVDGYRDQGVHRVTFKAAKLPTGTYFAVLKAGEVTQIKRMTLAK